MYKIVSIEVGNSPASERESYDKAELQLNQLEKDGWTVASTCWDDGGLQGGQGSGLVVFLHKK